MIRSLPFLLAALAVALAQAGCAKTAPELGPPPPAAVTVSRPLQRYVTDRAEFTGRTAAVESVQVRARVWGHLQKINFVEGADVKKDGLLFVIDQRPYRAALARAQADVAQGDARAKRVAADHARVRGLIASRAVSREEFDKTTGDLAEAAAATQSAKAALETARLNLEYTEVRAPVSGQVGRALVTVGNMVQSGENGGTILTTLVSVDPMYAYFDVDEGNIPRLRRLVNRLRVGGADRAMPIHLGLAGEQGHPHRGTIDFADNQVDPSTGTLKVRAVFPNKDRNLTPGLFARVVVPLGDPHRALLVTDRAIDTDQGQKVVYVVGKDDVVERRPVRLGGLHDGLREILAGLDGSERVVVDGIQRVRGGVTVQPRLVDMPLPLGSLVKPAGPGARAGKS